MRALDETCRKPAHGESRLACLLSDIADIVTGSVESASVKVFVALYFRVWDEKKNIIGKTNLDASTLELF